MNGKAAFILALATCVAACDTNPRPAVRPPQAETRQHFTSEAQNYLFNAEDFDLETVIGLIKDNRVSNAEELEKKINDPNSGINNVDLDKDGQADYIGVREDQVDGRKTLLFAAYSSADNGATQKTIAELTFSKDTATNETVVSGTYPSYANGYDQYAYGYRHSGLSVGDALFLSWMFSSRPVYVPVYPSYGYTPRPIMARDRIIRQRTTYRTETRVSPVQRQVVQTRRAAEPTKSTYAPSIQRPPATNRLSDRKDMLKDYQTRDPAREQKPATGFGAKKAEPTKSSGFFGGSSGNRKTSSSSPKPSRSSIKFGGSSGNRRR